MGQWWWSYLLTLVGVTGLLLAGRGYWQGWAVGIVAQVLWIVYTITTEQWGFFFGVGVYGYAYVTNTWKWWRKKNGTQDNKSRGSGTGEETVAG